MTHVLLALLHMVCRDLKAENVLMGGDGLWKLCDFGSTSTNHKRFEKADEMGLEEDIIRKHTTPAYRAPEVTIVKSKDSRLSFMYDRLSDFYHLDCPSVHRFLLDFRCVSCPQSSHEHVVDQLSLF